MKAENTIQIVDSTKMQRSPNARVANASNAHTAILGDVRASGYETTNNAAFHMHMMGDTPGGEIDPKQALEVDAEYAKAMTKVR